ncbi:MerC domain-containing protein [Alteromonas sp. LMIT006]|nr:MerC domain-containing protein [Alteromonas sp. LMIT006]UTP72921.1 MerC domain-containing protein [Alteromonas sp. LMIT006]
MRFIFSKDNRIDQVGVWLTSLCALHCIAVPVILPLVPLLAGSFFAEEWFERMVLLLSIVVGFIALLIGFYKYHRQLYPIYSLAMGGFIYWQKDMFGHHFEPLVVTIGAVLIIASHILNIRLCKACKGCGSKVASPS